MDEESQLIDDARRGSEAAFSQLLREHHAHVRAYLGSLLRHADEVDDLAQETFLTAFQSLAQYRGESSLRVWLFGIARHRVLRYLREEEHRKTVRSNSIQSSLARWLEESAELDLHRLPVRERELSALEGCVKKLAPASSALVREFYLQGLSAGDIARQSGKNEGVIWKTLSRIRQALRRCMQGDLAVEGSES